MNKKQYASSVHSQKSTASAKSGRSLLSFSSSALWKAANKREGQQQQQQKWYNLKSWIPSKGADNDSIKNSITTTNSTNSSSLSKIKRLLFTSSDSPKPPSSLTTTTSDSSFTNEISSEAAYSPTIVRRNINGILINRDGETADQHRKRKHKRRENIMKLQEHHQHHFHFRRLDSKNHQNHLQEHNDKNESSSSDTLLDDPDQQQQKQEHTYKKKAVSFGISHHGDDNHDDDDNNDDDENGDGDGNGREDEWMFNPRIIFVEPSPVPRFRNVAPPPPPSPPYMNILIDNTEDDYRSSSSFQSIINTMDGDTNYDNDDDDTLPTIFTKKDNIIEQQDYDLFENEHDRRISLLFESLNNSQHFEKPRLYFKPPLHRGQTLQFSLQNTIPEDHIILFKFLTSNTIPTNSRQERYFIRPSAGMITTNKPQPIMLFLNEVPPDTFNKDKILVKWVAIQRNTRIEDWLLTLSEDTRRKWIDMLQEEYPDQIELRSTRIRIRFL